MGRPVGYSPTFGQVERAVSFTTGDNPTGYTLSEVDVRVQNKTTSTGPQVSIYTTTPAGLPDSSLHVLNSTASLTDNSFATFTAPAGAVLQPNTTYAVVLQETGILPKTGNTGEWSALAIESVDEDPGAASGWSIADRNSVHVAGGWVLSALIDTPLMIAIRGTLRVSAGPETLKHTLASVASRTVAGALDNIGTRLGESVPAAGLALAGRPVSFGGSVAGGPERAGPSGAAHSRGMEAGELLGSSAFSLALGAAEGEPGFDPAALRWGIWGRGDYGAFEGRAGAGARYKGDMRTGWLGADARGGRWVAGLAVSRGRSETDYGGGRLETALTALWPYGRWRFADGLELRGLAGAGRGTARHAPGDAPRETSRLTMRAASLGVRQAFAPLDGFDLAARADASFARMETAKGEEAVDGLRADSWRLRGGLEASKRFALPDGAALSPFAELAARRDGGDGVAGGGIELAGGLRYAAAGVSVEARGRWLAAHSEKGARERGLSATVRLDPEAGGRGLSLALTPRWGAPAGGADRLWREDAPQASGASDAAALDARLGYGFALAPGAGGLLTPFAETGMAAGGDRRLRLGTRFEARGGALALELAGERRESANARPEHAVRLELRLGF